MQNQIHSFASRKPFSTGSTIRTASARPTTLGTAVLASLALAACSGGGSGSASGTGPVALDYGTEGFTYLTGVAAPSLAPTGGAGLSFEVAPAL
ncbi:MAG: hypothetical protein AAFZ65_06960, partial [Planctomycetota bacterium]